jgi:iron(III) transport system substrate-binding protein
MKTLRHPVKTLMPALVSALLLVTGQQALADTLTVYSARNEQLIKPLFDAYTKETGTQIQVLTDKEGPLLERLKAEGAKSPADVLITVDAGNLWHAGRLGLLRPIKSPVLNANIPANLRDPRGEWYGLSVRARTIIYNKKFVNPSKLSTYEALAEPEWKGKLCLRTSKKIYNQSLVATMMATLGEQKTEEVVRGWIANLATDVFADDNGVIKAVAAGQCEVGIVNTYYLARALDKDPNMPVGLFWANQKERGVHVNVSGAGVTKHAPNAAGGQKLIEWLSGDTAQSIYTNEDFEYPANPKVKPDSIIRHWGPFKMDLINVSKAGELQAAATKLMDRAGYR